MKNIIFTLLCSAITFFACTMTEESLPNNEQEMENEISKMAEVVSVTFSGSENNYTFSIGIKSPDTGCEQYANWWEIISADGSLLYRRILGHSHVTEQPFVRSGGIVEISSDQIIYIRAHMNNLGYGTKAYQGTIDDGFTSTTLGLDFAKDVESLTPQPGDCPF